VDTVAAIHECDQLTKSRHGQMTGSHPSGKDARFTMPIQFNIRLLKDGKTHLCTRRVLPSFNKRIRCWLPVSCKQHCAIYW